MPAIFVHGVPDTPRVWRKVLARLDRRDTVTLNLPGFGTPVPPGFVPTKEGYVDWLLAEVRRQPAPVDLIGHDWGGLLVVRAVSVAPDLVRSWAAGAAPLDPDYEWQACILTLYRSAVTVGAEWTNDLARVTAPGTVIWGEHDPYTDKRFGARLAERMRARFVLLNDCAHWWQLERPDDVARTLEALWRSLT